MENMEQYFSPFRYNTVGYNLRFSSCYGEQPLVYADWAASGRLYGPIEDFMSNTLGPFVGNTHSESSETGTRMTHAYHLARAYIKKHVNASAHDVLLFSGFGMTSAVNKFQRLLGLRLDERFRPYLNLPERLRPVVFVTHMEHHSNHISWRETCAEVVCIKPNGQDLVDLDSLRNLLLEYQDRPLKIGAFTACSNVTGIQTPYHDMARLMHEFGGICLVDFAGSAPYVDIDMHPADEGAKLDAIVFSPHKFLGGPGSSGVLVFDKRLYNTSIPDNPGGGTVTWTNPWGGHHYLSDIETREDGGTPGYLQALRAALALKLKDEMGVTNILAHEKLLLTVLLDGLQTTPGISVLAGNVRNRLGIVSFYSEDIHYNLFVRLLNDRFGIQARGGCSCAGTYGHFLLGIGPEASKKITDLIDAGHIEAKPGWVRLSLHPTITTDEVGYMVQAIRQIVKNAKAWRDDYIFVPATSEFRYIHAVETDKPWTDIL